jgi:hypothetical protein
MGPLRLRRRCVSAICCLHLAFAASAAFAQVDSAVVLGTARDAQGQAVADAAIAIANVDTGLARQTATDAEGAYRIAALPPGRYELTASRTGFRTVVRSGLILTLGAEAVLDVDLPVAGVSERLIVTADVPVVETTTSAIGMGLNRAQLDLLPNFFRDYTAFMRLSAGSQAFGSSFTGSRERSNEFTLDGVDNTSDISGFQRTDVALDTIQAFQVLANTYKAEHGRASGGVINVLTRSGTNRSSGSAFFAVSDDALNSLSPYASHLVPEPPFHRSIFGGTSGGPLVRDRWHYFLSYEGRDQDSQVDTTQVMPAATAPFSAATQQFLGANGIAPAIFGSGGLIRQVRPEYLNTHNVTARVDGQLRADQTFSVRYTFARFSRTSGQSGTLFDYNGDEAYTRDNYAVATHKWVLGATRLNEAYFHAGHTLSAFRVTSPALTNVVVNGAFSLGGTQSYPQGRSEPTYQAVDNFTWIRQGGRTGDHTIKAGANVRIFRSSSYFDNNVRGTFTFNSLQQFILGQPSFFTQFRGDTHLDRPNTISGVYLQDDWRPFPHVTLNLGVRYDYEAAKTEALREITGAPGPGIGGDTNNVAPRLGVVWAPGGSTKHAVYAGTGIYYDRIVLNILGNVRFNPPKVIGITITNPSFPNPTSGLVSIPVPSVQTIDPDLTTPYNLNSSVGYRRELTPSLGVDVSYVYNRGWDQVMTVDRNAGVPGSANMFGQGAIVPNPAITSDTFNTNLGFIRYKGLLVDVRKRLSRGVQGGVGYALSKTVDNGFSFGTPIQVPTHPELNDGPGANDRRHELKGHLEVELPFDIQLGALVEHYSEAPLNIFTASRDLNGDGIVGDWVNENSCLTVACPGFHYSRNSVRELSTDEANRLRGLLGLASIDRFANNPKYLNLNMTLQKSVRIGGRRARVTAEAFNVFNTPQRLIGSTSITSGVFGSYVAVVQPRVLQFTMQFDW